MMKKYEVPFNFAYDFESKLLRKQELFPYISCIYLPAYKEDAATTRYGIWQQEEYPKSYDEYLFRLKALMQLGIPICVLMQRGATLETRERYYDLGIRIFTMNDDALAVAMKERHKDVELTLSVTRALTEQELKTKDLSMYDRIVLFYWFSRHLDAVKALPKKYRYILMPNCECYWNCRWHDLHWFAGSPEDERKATDLCHQCVKELHDAAFIEPENLSYFDPYVDSYKLLDRLFSTDRILSELSRFAYRNVGAEKRKEDYFNVDA